MNSLSINQNSTGQERTADASPLTEAQRRQILVDWNQTAVDFPKHMLVHQLFEVQVARAPESVAVVFEDTLLTYRQLNERANRIALQLRKLGVGPDVLVGICVERSLEMIVGLLGILKAGGAYLPLDPQYPPDRLQFMLGDARPAALLTQQKLSGVLPNHPAAVVYVDAPENAEPEITAPVALESNSNSLAYVIYTSGSTGKPKGVLVPHRGIIRLVVGADYARFDSSRIFLQMSPVSFDASTLEIWGALLHGATCVIAPAGVQSPAEIGELIRRHGVTTLWLTAALYNMVIDMSPSALSSVSELLIGGEALSASHVQRGLRLLPNTQIINGYGPTENTTFTCCYRIPRDFAQQAATVPIGRPISNTQVYIVDSGMNPVPVGVAGELYTGGDGLARGYLNNPELTAEKFVASPFSNEPDSRLYRTGDMAQYLPDGNIEFLGRLDYQVKVRGFRIELGEIEAVLCRHPGVREAVVLARKDSGDSRLVAYVTSDNGHSPSIDDLRVALQRQLPDYMLPAAFVVMDQWPLTPNGKVDRQALPAPETTRPEQQRNFVAPQTPIEKTLASIWCGILGIDQVGIDDNFFELGGHSLLLVRLQAHVTKELGRRMPLVSFFESPTVKGFAELLSESNEAMDSSNVLTLRSEGEGIPIFFFHDLTFAQSLVKRMSRRRPVYGIHTCFEAELQLWEKTGKVTASIDNLATQCIKEMQQVQPRGPYCLAGFCFGGLVALEIAHQLGNQGEQTALVGLLDTYIPKELEPTTMISWWQSRAAFHLRQTVLQGPRYISYKVGERLRMKLLARSQMRRDTFTHEVQRRYKIKPYHGNVVMIQAMTNSAVDLTTDGWSEFVVGNFHIATIRCNHLEFGNEPHVSEVARELEKSLAETDIHFNRHA